MLQTLCLLLITTVCYTFSFVRANKIITEIMWWNFPHSPFRFRSVAMTIRGSRCFLYISEWLALSHGYKINIEFEIVFRSLGEWESKECERICVYDSRNVANRSNKRWPDRKIIEKYCRGDNNLFWQEIFFLFCVALMIRFRAHTRTKIRYWNRFSCFRYV